MSIEELEIGIKELSSLPPHERIEAINRLMKVIGEVHPNTDPVSSVRWVPAEMVVANSYNPNSVMPPEMRLLYLSIKEDGYTQPIVVVWDEERKKFVVVDGEHRDLVGKEYRDIRERTHGYVPIVILEKSLAERMASTIRHNRARGIHAVLGMVDLVVALVNAGLSDAEIGKQLGMDADEVLRLKQTSGIPALFKNRSYSRSWILDPERTKNDLSESDEQEGQEGPPARM
jgi:ParB-like chromosome segregation protein Spo0J